MATANKKDPWWAEAFDKGTLTDEQVKLIMAGKAELAKKVGKQAKEDYERAEKYQKQLKAVKAAETAFELGSMVTPIGAVRGVVKQTAKQAAKKAAKGKRPKGTPEQLEFTKMEKLQKAVDELPKLPKKGAKKKAPAKKAPAKKKSKTQKQLDADVRKAKQAEDKAILAERKLAQKIKDREARGKAADKRLKELKQKETQTPQEIKTGTSKAIKELREKKVKATAAKKKAQEESRKKAAANKKAAQEKAAADKKRTQDEIFPEGKLDPSKKAAAQPHRGPSTKVDEARKFLPKTKEKLSVPKDTTKKIPATKQTPATKKTETPTKERTREDYDKEMVIHKKKLKEYEKNKQKRAAHKKKEAAGKADKKDRPKKMKKPEEPAYVKTDAEKLKRIVGAGVGGTLVVGGVGYGGRKVSDMVREADEKKEAPPKPKDQVGKFTTGKNSKDALPWHHSNTAGTGSTVELGTADGRYVVDTNIPLGDTELSSTQKKAVDPSKGGWSEEGDTYKLGGITIEARDQDRFNFDNIGDVAQKEGGGAGGLRAGGGGAGGFDEDNPALTDADRIYQETKNRERGEGYFGTTPVGVDYLRSAPEVEAQNIVRRRFLEGVAKKKKDKNKVA